MTSRPFKLMVDIPPPLLDSADIFMLAKPITPDEMECSGLFKEFPYLRKYVTETVSLAESEAWTPRFFMWPDLVIGHFNWNPDPMDLIEAYREWRAEFEFEFSVIGGTAT